MYSDMPIHSIPLSEDLIENKKDDVQHVLTDIQIGGIFRFDIVNLAIELDRHIGGYLLPPMKGVYIPGKLQPVVLDGQQYFTKSKENEMIPVLDLNTVTGNVYSDIGDIVIPQRYMQPMNHKISNVPHIPVRAVNIIELILREQINDFSTWIIGSFQAEQKIIKLHFDYDKISNAFSLDSYKGTKEVREKQMTFDVEELITDVLSQCHRSIEELTNEIWSFLGNDNWHYHFLKIKETLVTIEKGEDYRLHQWEREHGHKYR